VYVPVAQLPDVFTAFVADGTPLGWIVRTESVSDELRVRLPAALRHTTAVPVWNVRSMNEIAGGVVFRERLSLWLMAAFGGAALVLAAIGLYGLVAHFVQQHAREIGIRLALGAEVSAVQQMVTGKGIRLVAAGGVIGLGCALALERPIARILLQPQEPARLAFLPVLVPVALAAALALWLAARRVSRVDPIVSVRQE
jgi:predicted lysophospholipase L1 biosynthesis ABC-type transport system permease subunit